jgi:anti-anti-sigma regulatory factor
MQTDSLPPKVQQADNVRIVTFTSGKLRDEGSILAGEPEKYTKGLEGGHLLLDFANVEYVRSVELALVITLHKRMKAVGGQFTLFNLNDAVHEVFAASRLDTFLNICK